MKLNSILRLGNRKILNPAEGEVANSYETPIVLVNKKGVFLPPRGPQSCFWGLPAS